MVVGAGMHRGVLVAGSTNIAAEYVLAEGFVNKIFYWLH